MTTLQLPSSMARALAPQALPSPSPAPNTDPPTDPLNTDSPIDPLNPDPPSEPLLVAENDLAESQEWTPGSRDQNLYRLVMIEGVSTRQAARQLGVSQTRVRQIVARVIAWLAEVLPRDAKRLSPEQALAVAQGIAADRLDHLYHAAMDAWRNTSQPRLVALASQVVVARARLPVALSAGSHLAALASDANTDTDADEDFPAPEAGRPDAVQADVAPSNSLVVIAPPLGDCSLNSDDASASSINAYAASEILSPWIDTNVDCHSTFENPLSEQEIATTNSTVPSSPLLTSDPEVEIAPTEVLSAANAEAILRKAFRDKRLPRRGGRQKCAKMGA